MNCSRRIFLAAAASAWALPVFSQTGIVKPPVRPLKILVLGGTNFVGPHLVQTAVFRGHEVTLFNRGSTNSWMFPTLEKLSGDRFPERGDGLSTLGGTRKWDAVIDTWQGSPRCVAATCELLRDRVQSYSYISSIAVYRNFRETGMSEDADLVPLPAEIASDDLSYAHRKRVAEHHVERNFGDRGHRFRCTSIAGFDHSGTQSNQMPYWPLRIAMGGEIAVPADDAPVQFVDVKDLAEFVLKTIERGAGGAYNVAGPAEEMTFNESLAIISAEIDTDHVLVKIPRDILERNKVRPFDDLKGYIPRYDPEPGFYQLDNSKAVAAGLVFRPYAETIRDFFRSYDTTKITRNELLGLKPEVEKLLVAEAKSGRKQLAA